MSTLTKHPHARGTCPDCGTDGWHPVKANEPSGLELECSSCAAIFYRPELSAAEIHGRIVQMDPNDRWPGPDTVLRTLDDITRRRRSVADELARIDTERDAAILAAIEAGHGAPTIAAHAGLTAARVYQIRDGRR